MTEKFQKQTQYWFQKRLWRGWSAGQVPWASGDVLEGRGLLSGTTSFSHLKQCVVSDTPTLCRVMRHLTADCRTVTPAVMEPLGRETENIRSLEFRVNALPRLKW